MDFDRGLRDAQGHGNTFAQCPLHQQGAHLFFTGRQMVVPLLQRQLNQQGLGVRPVFVQGRLEGAQQLLQIEGLDQKVHSPLFHAFNDLLRL